MSLMYYVNGKNRVLPADSDGRNDAGVVVRGPFFATVAEAVAHVEDVRNAEYVARASRRREMESKVRNCDRCGLALSRYATECVCAECASAIAIERSLSIKATRKAVGVLLRKAGFTCRRRARKSSGSTYYVRALTKIRLSDHELPMTDDRRIMYDDRGHGPNWHDVLLVNTHSRDLPARKCSDVIAELRGIVEYEATE